MSAIHKHHAESPRTSNPLRDLAQGALLGSKKTSSNLSTYIYIEIYIYVQWASDSRLPLAKGYPHALETYPPMQQSPWLRLASMFVEEGTQIQLIMLIVSNCLEEEIEKSFAKVSRVDTNRIPDNFQQGKFARALCT